MIKATKEETIENMPHTVTNTQKEKMDASEVKRSQYRRLNGGRSDRKKAKTVPRKKKSVLETSLALTPHPKIYKTKISFTSPDQEYTKNIKLRKAKFEKML